MQQCVLEVKEVSSQIVCESEIWTNYGCLEIHLGLVVRGIKRRGNLIGMLLSVYRVL